MRYVQNLQCFTEGCDSEWDVTVADAPHCVCLACAEEMDSDVLWVNPIALGGDDVWVG
jgi:hypothetical protein